MTRFFHVLLTLMIVASASFAQAIQPPDQVATIVVHGFDPDGTSQSGTVGDDFSLDYVTDIAGALNLPLGIANPTAANQVACTTYYGTDYPSYYTPQDIADVNAATAAFGGGVPRYAAIVAKYARHVMQRSGAKQINLVGLSFGALVSRYIIEKNLENLAGSDSIARWICVEGVVSGNYAATYGGPAIYVFFNQYYGGSPTDLDQMKYTWVDQNIHSPRQNSNAAYFANFPMHFWLAADDNIFNKMLTNLSGKANDGLVLLEDGYMKNMPVNLLYKGWLPTVSTLHATHDSMKSNEGLRAGLAAQVFGSKRVTITLTNVQVLRDFDPGKGPGEYVFGVKLFSPTAEDTMGTTVPIQDLRAEDNSIEYLSLSPNSAQSTGLIWFDDMVLPGETNLRLETNVEEIDGDLIYQITETGGEVRQQLANTQQTIDVTKNGTYTLATADWRGTIDVEIRDYVGNDNPNSAACDWELYQ